MFKILREKIKSWVKRISKESSQVERGSEEASARSKEVKKGFLKKFRDKVIKTKITKEDFLSYAEELRLVLIENNVAFEVTEKLIEELEEKIIGEEIPRREVEFKIKESFKEILESILIEPVDLISEIKNKGSSKGEGPYIILFVGVNGSGKTTTIAKVANLLKNAGLSCVIAAADTFRAASIEQLQKHGESLNVKIISKQYGADPASVAFDAIQYAKKNFVRVVLIDTAGRMHTSKNLMNEMEKISRVCKPDLKLFVAESITGNDSIEQARSFDKAIGIDGIVLTKMDVDEKGGTALSVSYVTKKPIFFLGTGQDYTDLRPFNKKEIIEKIFS
ncbi:MAG: signal recognition particle-docking protein FtsY [Candidatus Pacearchaeota archaeon]